MQYVSDLPNHDIPARLAPLKAHLLEARPTSCWNTLLVHNLNSIHRLEKVRTGEAKEVFNVDSAAEGIIAVKVEVEEISISIRVTDVSFIDKDTAVELSPGTRHEVVRATNT